MTAVPFVLPSRSEVDLVFMSRLMAFHAQMSQMEIETRGGVFKLMKRFKENQPRKKMFDALKHKERQEEVVSMKKAIANVDLRKRTAVIRLEQLRTTIVWQHNEYTILLKQAS